MKGLLLNIIFVSSQGLRRIISVMLGAHVPWPGGLTREDAQHRYPFIQNIYDLLREFGYLQIQATKADTAGNEPSLDHYEQSILTTLPSTSIKDAVNSVKSSRDGAYIPRGIAAFPQEPAHPPCAWAKETSKNLLTYSYMPRGGHFAASEEPELLAQDITHFVRKEG
ncbi:epoxide hydrolase 1-like [Cuculus canorus]|uniref:epoxide hydrolase 1-like n=1 Tax=Cuculus canorus TaxID=55661 RepID=UPI0023AAEB86|nr:epoxide hydrolase 1-like [Cuculus canorus]